MLITWEFIERVDSIYVPKFLTTPFGLITQSPIKIWSMQLTLTSCCLVPIIGNSVLSSLRSVLSLVIHTVLNSSDSLKLPGAFVWTERLIQLRVDSVAVNRGKVHLDNIKQFACINREKQWPEARALRYKSKFKLWDKFPWTITRWDLPLKVKWTKNSTFFILV